MDFTTSNPAAELKFTYTAPGFYPALLTVTDQMVAVYRLLHPVVVASLAATDQLLRGIYTGMLNRLMARDVAGAVQTVTIGLHDKYQAVFNSLKPDLPAVVSRLGTLREGAIGEGFAEYVVVRNTASGPQAFLIYFIRGEDGVWRIDGM